MNPEVIDYGEIIMEFIKFIAVYIIPIAAFVISIFALKFSRDTMNVKLQVSDVEEKLRKCELALREYELEKIQAEEQEERKAKVEARIIKITSRSYRLKVWNSGNTTAYNIEVSIPDEYNIVIFKDKMPFEYLEPGNSFEETVIFHMQSSSKFNIISSWEDKEGNKFTNDQLRSL